MFEAIKGMAIEAFAISASYATEEFFFNHPELNISEMTYR